MLGNGKQQKPYVHVGINKVYRIFNIKKNKAFSYPIIMELVLKILLKLFVNILIIIKVILEKIIKRMGRDVPKYRYDTKKLNKSGFSFKLSSSEAIVLAVKERYSKNYKYENKYNK